MERSPFAILPAEIRNYIYHLTLRDTETLILDFEVPDRHGRYLVFGQRHLLALTETCRQIRSESLPLFYGINDFFVVVGDLKWTAKIKNKTSAHRKEPLWLFQNWLRTIGFESARCIRAVEMNAFAWPEEGASRHVGYAVRLLSSILRFFVRTGKSTTLVSIFRCGRRLLTVRSTNGRSDCRLFS